MNLLRVAITWLLKKNVKEEKKVSEPLSEDTEQATTVVKTGVQDFEQAFQFVADGVAKLGEAAKDELIALAKKYL